MSTNEEKEQAVFAKLRSIILDNIETNETAVTPDATFEQLGADSLEVVDTTMVVEEEFDVAFSKADYTSINTIGDLVKMIVAKSS